MFGRADGDAAPVVVDGWPHVSLWDLTLPLALTGVGQSMLFAGLFRSVLADVPTHLGDVGVLITLQQSGLALGVATLGTLYLAGAEHNTAHAFATVEFVQMAIIALLAIGVAPLPRFTQSPPTHPWSTPDITTRKVVGAVQRTSHT